MANPDITTGTWVDVTYRQQFGNRQVWERELTALFMGQEGSTVFFNFRPIAGTSTLDVKDIISILPARVQKVKVARNIRRITKDEVQS